MAEAIAVIANSVAKKKQGGDENRLDQFIELLQQYTRMDFSRKAPLGSKGDKLDAIAAGLNTLGEEMEHHIQKLRESEERFRMLVENVKDYAIFRIDTGGRIITWNKGGERIKKYTATEILGKHISIFYTEEDIRNGVPEKNLKIAKEKGKYETEGWRVRKNGAKFWANIVYTALYDNKGNLNGYAKITRDMSERKKAEEKLKSSQSFLNSVIENIPNMIFVKDAKELRFVRLNKAGEELLGYSREELLGKNDYDFFPKEEADFFTRKDKETLKNKELLHIPEEFIETKTRGKRILETKKIPLLNEQGKPLYLLGISNDITDRKKTEAELKQKSEEITRSNAELEQFAYLASHDLQEPLRTVTSYVQLLKNRYKDQLDKDANEFIDFAVSGSNRMRNLINSLLQYSRANRVKAFENVDCNELLDEVLENMNSIIQETGTTFYYKNLPVVHGDRVLLSELFQNLFSNSIKFRNGATPEINISCKEEKNHYLFSVRDNGIGIDPKYSGKIFEIFQRLHTVDKYPGTGIGLAICRKIVERHGGKIWIESEAGNGSTFHFTISKT